METLEEFLTRLSLTQYSEQFASSSLKIGDLLPMSVSELNELLGNLGILKGHAIKLVMAILKLKSTYKPPDQSQGQQSRPHSEEPRPHSEEPRPQVEESKPQAEQSRPEDSRSPQEHGEQPGNDPCEAGGSSDEDEKSREEQKSMGSQGSQQPNSAEPYQLSLEEETTQAEDNTEMAALKRLSATEFEALRTVVERLVMVDLTPYRKILEEVRHMQKALAI
jgi:hypothetical protein